MSHWIQLYSGSTYTYGEVGAPGAKFWEDIAYPLAHQARYLGHTYAPWSVAAHATVASQVAHELKLGPRIEYWTWGHDNTEALVGDMPAPMKKAITELGGSYATLELIEDAARETIDRMCENQLFVPEMAPTADERKWVKRLDYLMLDAERAVLKGPPPGEWFVPHEFSDDVINMAANMVRFYMNAHWNYGFESLKAYKERFYNILPRLEEIA